MKKIMAGALAAAIVMGAGTTTAFTGADMVITANAAIEGNGTYESLTYYAYDGKIEICDFDDSVTSLVIPAEIEGLPVTAIRDSAFEGSTALESVVISEGISEIGAEAFEMCTSLKSVSLPSTLKSIDRAVFYNCISLEEIEIPKSVKEFEGSVFSGCANLRTVKINDGISKFYSWDFEKCNITTLYLPKSVTYIPSDAFLDGSVKEVYYAGSPEQWEIINESGREIFENSTIHFGAENFEGPLTPDVNRDGAIDASDASVILAYYAYTMTGGKGTIEEYLAK